MANKRDKMEQRKILAVDHKPVLHIGQPAENERTEPPKIVTTENDNTVRTTRGKVCDISHSKRWRGSAQIRTKLFDVPLFGSLMSMYFPEAHRDYLRPPTSNG